MIKLLKRLLGFSDAPKLREIKWKEKVSPEYLTKKQIEKEREEIFNTEIHRLKQLHNDRLERENDRFMSFYDREITEMDEICPKRNGGKFHYCEGLELESPPVSSVTYVSSRCVFCDRCEIIAVSTEQKEFYVNFVEMGNLVRRVK
jgi:hypothetical protein